MGPPKGLLNKYRISSSDGEIVIHNSLPVELSCTTLTYEDYRDCLLQLRDCLNRSSSVKITLLALPLLGLLSGVLLFLNSSSTSHYILAIVAFIFAIFACVVLYKNHQKVTSLLEKLDKDLYSKHRINLHYQKENDSNYDSSQKIFFILYYTSKYENAHQISSEYINKAQCDKVPLLGNECSIPESDFINNGGENAINIPLSIINE